ncbi:MAG TPA: PfkB family carbohydrate kinase [Solirubrobacteraceae bacterium]|nr:PfkB family carbohydrate kinase [Solirubrobacteraceae bacterium]
MGFDYAAVGHVTVDILPGGERRVGGTAFYSAIQAARLGLSAVVVTRGVPGEIEQLLAPYAEELELRVSAAERTTSLDTAGSGPKRRQRLLRWAGEIAAELAPDAGIVHLAPVAREISFYRRRAGTFVGLTPQGLVRSWSGPGSEIELVPTTPAQEALGALCSAMALSVEERDSCARLIANSLGAGAVVAVTAGPAGGALLLPDGSELEIGGPRVAEPTDDLGAGDVFAAAMFVELFDGAAPARAAAFAAAAAAVRLEGAGPGAIGDRATIRQRLGST